MKFSCNSCNTKYNLPDEKFAGKVITLTCKRCGAKIVVRPERQQTSSKTITEPERKLVQDSLEKRKTEPSLLKMPQVDRPSPYIKSPKLEGESLKKEQSIKESQPSRKRGEPSKRSIQQEEMKKNKEKGVEKGEETSAEKTEVESEGWYFSRGGQQKGPFTDDEIKELVENN
ncbi:MAG: zinc-ribbon domain-containing protein, partial [Myxococcota bacterium]